MVRVFSPFCVLVLLAAVAVAITNSEPLVRKRREWILPPKPLVENKDYTKEEYIAKIRSDWEDGRGNIDYSLEGAGASQHPFHVFRVDPKTGFIRVTQILDREKIATYNLSGVAKFIDGSHAEEKIDIRIKVVDENDNSPVFEEMKPVKVKEHSRVGTEVTKVKATDADEPGNENSQIAYTLVKQTPDDDMFYIKRDGTLCVKRDTLDRETTSQYLLTVKGQDLNGSPMGNTGTATVTINVIDVNDHPPVLEKNEYDGRIKENTYGVEVMRLKSLDEDQVGTKNWEAVYDIIKGNEAGYFSIRTDPKTNEGILMLDKAVDYEDVKDLDLGIIVRNVAPQYDGSTDFDQTGFGFGPGAGVAGVAGGEGGDVITGASAGGGGGSIVTGAAIPGVGISGGAGVEPGVRPGTGPGVGPGTGPGVGPGTGPGVGPGGTTGGSTTPVKVYSVKINVDNEPEGPSFNPEIKAIPISEGGDVNIDDVIGLYPAIDEDTGKPAENVQYAKGLDPANWLIIDPKTAKIKLNKVPDRESPYLVNGTYYAKVLCISQDMPGKTATGTIAIQVEDFNDHCPTLTSSIQSICTTEDAIIVNAKDEDDFPNGAPFHFTVIPERTQGKWQAEHLNDTAAILRVHEKLWPGEYEVVFEVTDMQGLSCPEPQKVKVPVCTCEDGVKCGKKGGLGQSTKSTQLGPAGIGMLFLGLLLLLLIPLLALFCGCGGPLGLSGFAEIPFDTKSHLINYHTEGQGENTAVPLVNMPTHVDGNLEMGMASKVLGAPVEFQNSVASMDAMNGIQQGFGSAYREGTWGRMGSSRAVFSEFGGTESRGMFDDIALPDEFLEQYYNQKLSGQENLGVKDSLLVYDYEGQGSSAGSVGCCSSLGTDNDLQFLNDLGPKFKTLAEVCGGKKISTEVKPVITPLSNASVNTEIKPVIPPISRETINTVIKPVIPPLPTASINTQTSVSNVVSTQQLPPPAKPQPMVSKTEQTVVKETSKIMKNGTATARDGMAKVKGGMANQGQVLMLQQQQPVYYTTTPMLQPMHYVVQPQVPNTVLLADAPASSLQGMVLVNGAGTIPTQGLVVQGQTMMATGQAPGPSMVLVDSSGGQGLGTNLVHAGSLSGPQAMMVMDGAVPSGSKQSVKGGQTLLVQGGTLQSGGLAGTQRVLVVGGPASSTGQLVQEVGGLKKDLSGSQKALHRKSSTSTGSTTKLSTAPTYNKVVVQENSLSCDNENFLTQFKHLAMIKYFYETFYMSVHVCLLVGGLTSMDLNSVYTLKCLKLVVVVTSFGNEYFQVFTSK
uniref:Desmoglein-2-like n=1 Tax=Sphaeramia orbicularis TaxID=375764 RepID=A0A672Z4B7_9TELE